jgi:hypothetical protein
LADLEKQFHKYFFTSLHEMHLVDLIAVRQRNDESVSEYIQRFRDVRSRCFSLNLTDGQLAQLAFQGLLPAIKDKYSALEFESLGHIIQRISLTKAIIKIPEGAGTRGRCLVLAP